jgi:glycosyltransferase involved in cell wall biosynthesis
MVPGIHQGVVQRLKAATQRHAYRQAWRRAALMVYNSRHMQDLYRRNAGGAMERASCIAYQAIDDDTHAAAQTLETQVKRQPDVILAVSAMAAWKGIETIVDSLATLLRQGCHARLRLVGPWPNPEYERRIREQIAARDLVPFVTITGQVSRDELHREYAAARVFCLMSHCESFGIPAIEAQAFGTPVVGSSTCAMPEIGGDGGEYCDPTDAPRVAELLGRLLEDPRHWQDRSDRARVNAARYRWEKVSRPLMAMFETEGHVS